MAGIVFGNRYLYVYVFGNKYVEQESQFRDCLSQLDLKQENILHLNVFHKKNSTELSLALDKLKLKFKFLKYGNMHIDNTYML